MSARHAKSVNKKQMFFAVFRRLLVCLCIAAAFTFAYCALILHDNSRAVYELTYSYEQASEGLTSEGTRLVVSQLKSEPVLTAALANIGVNDVSAQELAGKISIEPLKNADGTPSLTRYCVTYQDDLLSGACLDAVRPQTLLNAVLEEYAQEFSASSLAAVSVPAIDWDEYASLEYTEAGNFLARQSARLVRFVRDEKELSSACLLTLNAEQFAALERQLANFQAVDLENYNAFVRQSGLAKDSARLTYALQHWSLLQALTGVYTSEEQAAQNSLLLQKLTANTATPEDAQKAQQMLDSMQQMLTAIAEQAAALQEEFANQRAQQSLTLTYQPGLTEGWHLSWALLTGVALFVLLCLGGLLPNRKVRCRHEKH